jgi:hypothetical protein
MQDTTQHWNQIFETKSGPQLGWYEPDAAQTLGFLREIEDLSAATIFLPGAGTSVLVPALLPLCQHLVLNDLSDTALQKLRETLQPTEKISWFHHDLSRPFPEGIPPVDLWIDRAVLHFLLEETQIEGYFQNLRATVRAGGFVLLAEFAPDGASKCAGLDVHRYSAEELAERIGAEFLLIRQERYVFITPAGDPRPYTYALFQRRERP